MNVGAGLWTATWDNCPYYFYLYTVFLLLCLSLFSGSDRLLKRAAGFFSSLLLCRPPRYTPFLSSLSFLFCCPSYPPILPILPILPVLPILSYPSYPILSFLSYLSYPILSSLFPRVCILQLLLIFFHFLAFLLHIVTTERSLCRGNYLPDVPTSALVRNVDNLTMLLCNSGMHFLPSLSFSASDICFYL